MHNITPINADSIAENKNKSLYPEPFASMVKGRSKRKLGDHFGLTNFGVNLTKLSPGTISALKHHHSKQDEFIYILSGIPTLIYGDNEYLMAPGDGVQYPDDDLSFVSKNDGTWLVLYKDGTPY